AFRFHLVLVTALPTIVYLIYRIFSYAQQLMDSLQMINGSLPYLQNVMEYEGRAQEREEIKSGSHTFSLEREIRFDDVRFAYEGGKDVLHKVTFVIPRGSMIGLIGPSGAGK